MDSIPSQCNIQILHLLRLGALPNAGFPFGEDAPKVNEDITTYFLF